MILALLAQHGPEAQEATEGGLGGPFVLEPGLIIWTWLVFIVLFFMLRKYAWPPIVRLTVEREKLIAKQLDEAERANADAKAALEEHKQLLSGAKDDALSGAKDDAHKLINEAKGLASKEREHMLAQAREEQQQVLERAKREIAVERERAVAELRRTAVDLSLAAASKLIEQRLDSDADRKIVEEYLDTLEDSSR
jgi:F-type H+-transporting ATPase subunit b